MHIKPNFVPKQIILETAGSAAGIIIFLFLVVTLPILEATIETGEPARKLLHSLGFSVIILPILGAFASYFWKKATYNASDYHFKEDRVDYSESFFNQEEKELTYDRIIEVSHKRNIIQRLFGTGTIFLQTHATPNVQGGSGLKIPDLLESQERYKKIRGYTT